MLRSRLTIKNSFILMSSSVFIASIMTGSLAVTQEKINREILPIVAPEPETYTELDVRNTKPPVPFNVEAPKDAPNVVIVLIDDLGFGATSTYGGPIKHRPWIDWQIMACAIIIFIPLHFVLRRGWH